MMGIYGDLDMGPTDHVQSGRPMQIEHNGNSLTGQDHNNNGSYSNLYISVVVSKLPP